MSTSQGSVRMGQEGSSKRLFSFSERKVPVCKAKKRRTASPKQKTSDDSLRTEKCSLVASSPIDVTSIPCDRIGRCLPSVQLAQLPVFPELQRMTTTNQQADENPVDLELDEEILSFLLSRPTIDAKRQSQSELFNPVPMIPELSPEDLDTPPPRLSYRPKNRINMFMPSCEKDYRSKARQHHFDPDEAL